MKARSLRCLMVIAAIAAAVLVTGCGADVDQTITFFKGGGWEADMTMGISKELLELSGATVEEWDTQLESQVDDWKSQGLDVKYDTDEDEGLVSYIFHFEGEGIDQLQEIGFGNDANLQAIDVDGQRQIHFSQFSTQGLFGEAGNYTLTLVGGEVISTNGRVIEDGTVQWVNPSGLIEAVLTEKSKLNLGLLLFASVVIVAAAVLFMARGSIASLLTDGRQGSTLAAPTAHDQVGTAYCPSCGTPLSATAKFCPKCGQKQA